MWYFIVVVLVSLFKFDIQNVVWYFKGLLWTFFCVHACVILGDFCYSVGFSLQYSFMYIWKTACCVDVEIISSVVFNLSILHLSSCYTYLHNLLDTEYI